MKWLDWLKKITNMDFSKKTINNLIIVLCLGIAFLIIADFLQGLNQNTNNNAPSTSNNEVEVQSITDNLSETSYVRNLENKLSSILSKIDNAGQVSVMITLKGSTEMIPAKDESLSDKVTNENDTSGGTRVINESITNDKVVFSNEQGGNSKPLIVKEINPEVKGVIVVADGAKDGKLKLKLSEAVQTILDVPAYRVTVYERN